MQTQTKIAILSTLLLAIVTTTATCQCTKSQGEQRAREAQENAKSWEAKARAYAETLERAEEARTRAEQSLIFYKAKAQEAGEQSDAARQIMEEIREDEGVCHWLDSRIPDGVRDVLGAMYTRSNCD